MIYPYGKIWPKINPSAFIAPSADVIGDVEIGAESSIWFQVVIRGDVNSIKIGSRTNVQDSSVLHVTREKFPLKIGNDVTIGHRVMVHGCTIGNSILVGMSSTILDGAEIGDNCFIGAGSLITQGMKIPSNSMVFGSPAKVVRPLKPEELAFLPKSAQNYVNDSREYLEFLKNPDGQSYTPQKFGEKT